MTSNRTWSAFLLVALAVTIPAAFPPVSAGDHSTPLHPRSLGSVRGADLRYKIFGLSSCDSKGASAMQTITGNPYVPSSGCGVANIGFNCAGCTQQGIQNFGVNGTKVPYGQGQQPTDGGACGDALAGMCVVTGSGPGWMTYGCQNMQPQFGANGLPVGCSDLLAAGPQL